MNHPFRALGALLIAAAAWAPAWAGNVTASALENTVGSETDTNAGSHAFAAFSGLAWAETTRTSITAHSIGLGTGMPAYRGASGAASTSYTLWDTVTGSALDAGIAGGLTLAFDFTLAGMTDVPAASLSTGSMNFDATLYSAVASGAGGGVSVVYGPVPPFPKEGYGISGDVQYFGGYLRNFTLEHQHASGGLWTMGLGTQASNAGSAEATLSLHGIRLVEGTLAAGRLAVMLETGELLAVSAVPEPASGALLLAGLAAVAGIARRRAAG